MTVLNERRGFLKVLCALLDVDFTGWRDVRFVQFFLGENVEYPPSNEAVLSLFLDVESEGRTRHDFRSSLNRYSVTFRKFRGISKDKAERRFHFTADQKSFLRSKFKGISFEVLATIFTSPTDEENFEKALWNRPDVTDFIYALRRCDGMSYGEIQSILKSKNKVFVDERKAEPTPDGLAAVAALQAKLAAIVVPRPVSRPRLREESLSVVSGRRGISVITSAPQTMAPPRVPSPPVTTTVGDEPATYGSPIQRIIQSGTSINSKHDHQLTTQEIAALVAFWNRHLGKSMILNTDSFQTIFSCYVGIESGCSVIIKQESVTEARMFLSEHPKLEAWIKKGCPTS